MKKLVAPLMALLAILAGCTAKVKTIHFNAISGSEFNAPIDTAFIPHNGQSLPVLQHLHDSCMGMSFPANAFFMRSRDTFSLGCIINKHNMQVVKDLATDAAAGLNIYAMVRVIAAKPCYNKITDNVPLDSFFRKKVALQLPAANAPLQKELDQLLNSAVYTTAETGAWTYVELTSALEKLLDTTTNTSLLQYKEALLQPDNLVLMRSGGVTDFTFHVTTARPVSAPLKALLMQKPFTTVAGWEVTPQLFYEDDTHIEVNLIGYFQVMGQFMKAEVR